MGRVFFIQYDPSPFHYLLTCSTCNMHILRLPRCTAMTYVAGYVAAIFGKLMVNVMTDDSERFWGTGMRRADLHCVSCLTKLGFKRVEVTHPNTITNEGTVFLDIQKLRRNGRIIPVPVQPDAQPIDLSNQHVNGT